MSVLPWAWRVSAVARITKNITRFEEKVPKPMSSFRSTISLSVAPWRQLGGDAAHGLLLLDLLGGLPEEEIGADRRPQQGHQGGPAVLRLRQGRDERVVEDLPPVGMEEQRRDDVGDEDEGQPLEDPGDLLVPQPDRGHHDEQGEDADEVVGIEAGQHLGGVGHAGEVGGDVEAVRGEQAEGDEDQEGAGEAGEQVPGQAAAGDHADARAHHLDGGHQGPGQEGRPQERRAKLGAGDRERGDARRVVIRGTGDHTWAESREETADGMLRLRHGVSSGSERCCGAESTAFPGPEPEGI